MSDKNGKKFHCCIHIFTLVKEEKDCFLASCNISHKKMFHSSPHPVYAIFKDCVKIYLNSCAFWAWISCLHKNLAWKYTYNSHEDK